MAALSDTPPPLRLDPEELKRWGYVWRVGTQVRAADTAEDADADPSHDYTVDDAESGAVSASAPGKRPAEVRGLAGRAKRPGARAAATAVAPPLTAEEAGVPPDVLARFDPHRKYPSAFSKKQGMNFGFTFDLAVGNALAEMLGNGPVHVFRGSRRADALLPNKADCVEVGPARIIGGVRPQNFDVAYRPDGVRIAYDSKTLNDAASISKNWQNMINDLGTEATTVHTRFPYAVVAFIVAVPKPALRAAQQADMVRTLERLATRKAVIDQAHLAEAIALVAWDPETGGIDADVPGARSVLRVEEFMPRIHRFYTERYKGLPPHDK